MKQIESMVFLNQEMRQDDIFVPIERKKLSSLIGLPVRDGLEDAIVSNGRLVNVVSDNYGLLTNQEFFGYFEEKLQKTGISYKKRMINHNDVRFVVDFILDIEQYAVKTYGDVPDNIKPVIRTSHSYDGSARTSGGFGFFREWCSNHAHTLDMEIAFKLRRTGRIYSMAQMEVESLIEKFIKNEYFSIHKKFEVMAEAPIKDLKDFVKQVSGITGLFNFERSEQNPNEPSKNAQIVMNTIDTEAKLLHTSPNMWIGYNAFNAFIHNTQNEDFDKRAVKDEQVFRMINLMAMN